jgi:hypothetical protein
VGLALQSVQRMSPRKGLGAFCQGHHFGTQFGVHQHDSGRETAAGRRCTRRVLKQGMCALWAANIAQ